MIGVINNAKPNTRALLVRTGELVVTGSGARQVRVFSKPGLARAEAALLDEIARQCGLVLTGSVD